LYNSCCTQVTGHTKANPRAKTAIQDRKATTPIAALEPVANSNQPRRKMGKMPGRWSRIKTSQEKPVPEKDPAATAVAGPARANERGRRRGSSSSSISSPSSDRARKRKKKKQREGKGKGKPVVPTLATVTPLHQETATRPATTLAT
jgi:hypothetical protein